MQRTFLSALMAGAAFTIAVLGAGQAEAQSVMKIGHFLPPGDPRDLGAQKVEELVEADDRCDIDVQIFPSSQLGSFDDINEGVQFGSIEMSLLPASYIVGTDPLFGVFDLPFFWPQDAEALISVYDSAALDPLRESIKAHNMELLDVWHTGFKTWTSTVALDTLEAYRGLTARVMPSEVLVEQDKVLGMQPVTMPFSETYTALQTGAVDAQENPIAVNWNMKFYEVQPFITLSYHGQLDQVLLVNQPWFGTLSADCQSAIREALHEGRKVALDATRKQEEQALEAFREHGNELVELSAETRDELREAVLPKVRSFYIDQTGETGQSLVEALEEEITSATGQ